MLAKNSHIHFNQTKENIIYTYNNYSTIFKDQLEPSILLLDKKCCYCFEI